MNRSVRLVSCLAFLLAARCSNERVVPPPAPPRPPVSAQAPASAQADEAFRKAPPARGQAAPFRVPSIEEGKLPNGIRVLLVEHHDLPIVSVHVGVARGADQARAGLGAFAGALLLSGTTAKSALALSDALKETGAHYGASIDYDGADLGGQVLRSKLPAFLDLLGDVVQHPAFDPKEIERERAKRITAVAQQNDDPRTVLYKSVLQALYPERHPYRTLLLGDQVDLAAATRADFSRFYRETFRPPLVTIAFAGDITKEDALAEAARVFGAWKGAPSRVEVPSAPDAPAAAQARILLVDRPKASQSHVALALPGVERKNQDFDRLTVMNTILGGQFSSRLNLNLRERHGYTYGASSRFEFRRGPGPFLATSAVEGSKTVDALREMLTEVSRMRTELVSEEELADAKTGIVRKLPARFETAETTAETLASLAVQDLPLDEFATRPARIGAVTREDVRRVAESHLAQDRLRIVVVGDASSVEPALTKLADEMQLKLEVRKATAPSAATMKKEGPRPQ